MLWKLENTNIHKQTQHDQPHEKPVRVAFVSFWTTTARSLDNPHRGADDNNDADYDDDDYDDGDEGGGSTSNPSSDASLLLLGRRSLGATPRSGSFSKEDAPAAPLAIIM